MYEMMIKSDVSCSFEAQNREAKCAGGSPPTKTMEEKSVVKGTVLWG